MKTVANEMHKALKELGVRSFHKDGLRDLSWVVLDYFDVIVHVFLKETREYYNLEALWGDAKIVYPEGKEKTEVKKQRSKEARNKVIKKTVSKEVKKTGSKEVKIKAKTVKPKAKTVKPKAKTVKAKPKSTTEKAKPKKTVKKKAETKK